MLQRQRTIREKAALTGIGLHTGQQIRINIFPAAENEGITFMRPAGKKLVEIAASHKNVIDTRLATTLGKDGEMLSTVEHFLAATSGLRYRQSARGSGRPRDADHRRERERVRRPVPPQRY